MSGRWIIEEYYDGIYKTVDILASTESIEKAAKIIKAMKNINKDKPLKYRAKKLAKDNDPIFDITYYRDPTSEIEVDYTDFLKWY